MSDPEQAQFEAMLIALGSDDNEYRKKAEDSFAQTKVNAPVWLMQALAEVGTNSTNRAAGQLALVELRKLLGSKERVYEACNAEAQTNIKARLLQVFGGDCSPEVRRAISGCVSNLAVKDPNWPELWPSMMKALKDNTMNPDVRASCCDVYSQLASYIVVQMDEANTGDLVQGLSNCMETNHDVVRRRAFEAIAALSACLGTKRLKQFEALVPLMLRTLQVTLDCGNFKSTTELCQVLSGHIETTPEFFLHATGPLLQGLMGVASTFQVDLEARHIAIEVMLTYCEAHPKAIRRVHGFTKSFFELLFSYLLNPEIEVDWQNREEADEDTSGSSDFEIGSTALDRLTCAIKGKHVKEIATQIISSNLNHQDWRYRNAALTTITYIVEGLREEYDEHLKDITNMVTNKLEDPNEIVRNAALMGLTQLSSDFAPKFQQEHAELTLPLAVRAFNECPHIQCQACALINNFFDEGEDADDDDKRTVNYLKKFVPNLTLPIVQLYKSTNLLFVKNECLQALSSMISACTDAFTPYVNDLVPLFQEVLALDETPKGIRGIKCIAIECVTLLASGVGKEAFGSYGHPVCQYLMGILGTGLANDDPRMRYILRGWTCMVECLKGEVLQYLDNVLPQLYNVANTDCDLEIITKDPGDPDPVSNDDVQEYKVMVPGEGEKIYRTRTSLVEDKDLALNIILTMFEDLHGLMQPYFQQLLPLAMGCLTFKASNEIRQTATGIIAELVFSYNAVDQASVPNLVNHVVPALINAIDEEDESDMVFENLKTIVKIIHIAPQGALSNENTERLTKTMIDLLKESTERRKEQREERAEAEQDDEELNDCLDAEEEDEDTLMEEVASTVAGLLETTPHFHQLFTRFFLPIIQTLLTPNMDEAENHAGISLLCEFVAKGYDTPLSHLSTIFQVFTYFAGQGKSEILTQGAFYGGGLTLEFIAKHSQQLGSQSGESQQFVQSFYGQLNTYLQSPYSLNKDWDEVTDNAVSAALKFIEHFGSMSQLDLAPFWTAIVRSLPGKGDPVEAKILHEKLLRWASAGQGFPNDAIKQQVVQKLKTAKNEYLNEVTLQELAKY